MINKLRVRIESHWYLVEVGDLSGDDVNVVVDGQNFKVNLKEDVEIAIPPTSQLSETVSIPANSDFSGSYNTPMPGSVINVLVKQGDQVTEGEDVCILESMKMQQVLKSDFNGVVTEIMVSSGDQVLDGDELIRYS